MRLRSVALSLAWIANGLFNPICMALEELNDEELSQQTGQAIQISKFDSAETMPANLVGLAPDANLNFDEDGNTEYIRMGIPEAKISAGVTIGDISGHAPYAFWTGEVYKIIFEGTYNKKTGQADPRTATYDEAKAMVGLSSAEQFALFNDRSSEYYDPAVAIGCAALDRTSDTCLPTFDYLPDDSVNVGGLRVGWVDQAGDGSSTPDNRVNLPSYYSEANDGPEKPDVMSLNSLVFGKLAIEDGVLTGEIKEPLNIVGPYVEFAIDKSTKTITGMRFGATEVEGNVEAANLTTSMHVTAKLEIGNSESSIYLMGASIADTTCVNNQGSLCEEVLIGDDDIQYLESDDYGNKIIPVYTLAGGLAEQNTEGEKYSYGFKDDGKYGFWISTIYQALITANTKSEAVFYDGTRNQTGDGVNGTVSNLFRWYDSNGPGTPCAGTSGNFDCSAAVAGDYDTLGVNIHARELLLEQLD